MTLKLYAATVLTLQGYIRLKKKEIGLAIEGGNLRKDKHTEYKNTINKQLLLYYKNFLVNSKALIKNNHKGRE